MPNTQLLITTLQNQIKERDDRIKLQHKEILHLRQDISRLTSIVDAEMNYREGSE